MEGKDFSVSLIQVAIWLFPEQDSVYIVILNALNTDVLRVCPLEQLLVCLNLFFKFIWCVWHIFKLLLHGLHRFENALLDYILCDFSGLLLDLVHVLDDLWDGKLGLILFFLLGGVTFGLLIFFNLIKVDWLVFCRRKLCLL